MNEVSIKFRKNATRGNITPLECINLWSPLNPDGARGVKFGTNMIGGDGHLEFSIRDPGPVGSWPGKKNDGAEVYYGVDRVTQHSVYEAKRNEMEGALDYVCQGHSAHYGKGITLAYAVQTQWHWYWWRAIFFGAPWGGGAANEGLAASNINAPFLTNSLRFFEDTGGPQINTGWAQSETVENIAAELLKHVDSIYGIFPGRVARPDELGCFPYLRARTGGSVKWYATREDLAAVPGGYQLTEDWSRYCNYVVIYYKDSLGVVQQTYVEDTASQDFYTPGSQERHKLDLTNLEGYLDATKAQAAGNVYLGIYSQPVLKGSVTLPLTRIQRTGGGMQWAGFIRGGDTVRLEHDEFAGGTVDVLADSTEVDIDASTIMLNMPEPIDMESTLASLLAA